MEELQYKDGRIYQITTKDITGEFDIAAEIARMTKERDELTVKIDALTGAKTDIDAIALKANIIETDEPISGETITTK